MTTESATTPEIYDLTIIGGGPVGLFAAYYAGMRGMKTKIVDSLTELGGQLTTLYPEKFIYDVAGFPKVLARDLANNLIAQAMQYSPAVTLGETVQTLEHLPDATAGGAFLVTSDVARHYTRTLLISAGAGAFQPRKLAVAGVDRFENDGIYYSVKTKSVFIDKRVLVIGGGDSAVDWSNNLLDTARSVTLVHRRNQFRAHEENVHRLQARGVPILTFLELHGLVVSPEGKLHAAILADTRTHETRTLEIDAIIAQIGFISSLGPIKNWPIQIERGSITVNRHMETTLPGIYAAGDVTAYDGKLKLIATGFGEAAVAVNYAKNHLDPKAKVFPGHSSEMSPDQPNVTV
jgi:ferredoxin/flavodoxin---NADP+ reductase